VLGNVIKEKSAVSPALALRLGKFFGNGAEIWMGLQADIDLWNAREEIAPEIDKIKRALKQRVA
jgi:antitoxin HigA-1